MNNLVFEIHGKADHASGLLEMLTGLLDFLEKLAAGGEGSCGIFATLFPGIANIENIHPLFVHFPIALLSCFFVLDALGWFLKKTAWREAASYFLYIGAVSAIATVLAGFHAAYTLAHGPVVHEIMENHEHLGVTVLTLAIGLSVWRLRSGLNTSGGFLFAAGLMCLLMAFGADLGGLMVYGYGTAVRAPIDCHAPLLED